jgi:DNA segregation ATPase FtsK/SpoIIIE and related proteins
LVSKDLLSNGKRLASYPLWNHAGKISRPAFTVRG